ncbi:MAG: Motility protein [Pseudomonadota bacterium]|jgi:chemotaxis protein MotB
MADEKPAEQAAAEGAPAEGAPAAAEAPAEASNAPVIVIKKVIDEGHGGAHGGAWKIALADMMTAMMAFFLLMWLLGASNADQRKSIADYFRPSSHSLLPMGQLAGSNGVLGGKSIIDTDGFPYQMKQTGLLERLTPRSEGGPNPNTPPGPDNENDTPNNPAPNQGMKDEMGQGSTTGDDNNQGKGNAAGEAGEPGKGSGAGNGGTNPDKLTEAQKKAIAKAQDEANFKQLEQEIKQKLLQDPNLKDLRNQVAISRDRQGLRIEIIDKADFAMFPSGGTNMADKADKLVQEVAAALNKIPNKVAIRGHTDSVPFAKGSGKNNWALSGERAEATRSLLEKAGVSEKRFERIEGVADTDPFNPKDPKDPRNRRMSITVLNIDN